MSFRAVHTPKPAAPPPSLVAPCLVAHKDGHIGFLSLEPKEPPTAWQAPSFPPALPPRTIVVWLTGPDVGKSYYIADLSCFKQLEGTVALSN